MASKAQLRTLREGAVINATSKFQDKILGQVVIRTMHKLHEEFPGIRLQLDKTWKLTDIVKNLRSHFPDVDFQRTYLHVQGERFNRGSFYFKVEDWQEDEMFEIASEIAEASIYYYFSKYGKPAFIHT